LFWTALNCIFSSTCLPPPAKIPLLQLLDLFNYSYLSACQTLCIVPIQKVKLAIADAFSSKSPVASLSLDNLTLLYRHPPLLPFPLPFITPDFF